MECHLSWQPVLERALDLTGITEALVRVVESLVEPGGRAFDEVRDQAIDGIAIRHEDVSPAGRQQHTAQRRAPQDRPSDAVRFERQRIGETSRIAPLVRRPRYFVLVKDPHLRADRPPDESRSHCDPVRWGAMTAATTDIPARASSDA